MRRVITGIQPSGELHIGNYLGAIKPLVDLQNRGEDDLYVFVADMHALTSSTSPGALREHTINIIAQYVALGLDPSKVKLFRQSKVYGHAELAWVLGCRAPMGLLERAHSYKDKIANGLTANVGLFYYPVLMAADILIHRAEVVPVGKDQVQHVEITRDLAGYMNNTYGTNIPLPDVLLGDAPYVPGLDGRKMSKSYDNVLPVMATAEDTRRLVKTIVTDSSKLGDPIDVDSSTVAILQQYFSTDEFMDDYRGVCARGCLDSGAPFGHGHAKNTLANTLNSYFAAARSTYLDIVTNVDGKLDHIVDNMICTEMSLSKATREHLDEIYIKIGLR